MPFFVGHRCPCAAAVGWFSQTPQQLSQNRGQRVARDTRSSKGASTTERTDWRTHSLQRIFIERLRTKGRAIEPSSISRKKEQRTAKRSEHSSSFRPPRNICCTCTTACSNAERNSTPCGAIRARNCENDPCFYLLTRPEVLLGTIRRNAQSAPPASDAIPPITSGSRFCSAASLQVAE